MRMALFLALLLSVGTAAAESVYISDVLRVGVRTLPNSNEAPVAVVTSGTELQVLERQDGYLRVKTPDGVEGWIADAYATTEVPARMRLERAQKERDALQGEVDKLRSNNSSDAAQAQQLREQLATLQEENAKLQAASTELSAQLQAKEGGHAWVFYAAAMVLLFGLGIYLGVRWDKERVAQRFGGLEL